jgi:non-canonical (house-cleaning) NTP pyrophosphatase
MVKVLVGSENAITLRAMEEAFSQYSTKGVMDRKRIYVDGLIAALVPFLNEELYFQ